MFKTRKNESFCRGVNPFRNAKLGLLSNSYCFTTCTCKVVFEQSSNTIGTWIDPLLVNQMETEGNKQEKGVEKALLRAF